MSGSTLEADVVVIGSGFGGTMTALTIAHKLHPPELRDAQNKLKAILKDDPEAKQPATQNQLRLVEETVARLKASGALRTIVILERGTWWTTPVPTVQDGKIATPEFLKKHRQPVQYWSSLDHFKGVIDLFTRCFRRPKWGPFPGNEDGLYDLSHMGRKGFLGIFGGENDGVSVMRACGVGGGSLVYSNITVRPPEFIFDGWDTTWTKANRDTYYELAKHAIGYGIVLTWTELGAGNIPYHQKPNVAGAANAGLSNVSTQTARLDPHWETEPDPFLPANSPRSVKRLGADGSNWLTRARVFQTAMKAIRPGGYHTVDSSINDLTPERTLPGAPPYDPNIPANHPPDPAGAFPKSVNYCERQGRCTLGCLPGARHTLNKQLMGAVYGKPTDPVPVAQFPNIEIRALAEADTIEPAGEGWAVHYFERDREVPARKTPRTVTARRVIMAAGCLGTNELLLRSRPRLPNLSPSLGEGFSTNGDYLAFLEEIKEPVNLTRGPVQTSVAHFNDRPGEDTSQFHIVEDQGIPKVLSTMVGFGLPLIRALTRQRRFRLVLTLVRAVLQRLRKNIGAISLNARQRQEFFRSEEELTMKMMAVTASGRDQARGKFRLGGRRRESPLRVSRTDEIPFHQDPIFATIDATLNGPDGNGGLAAQLLPPEDRGKRRFRNPFLSETADALAGKSVTITHPLGGCRIGRDATRGVVDEFGRVYDASAPGKYYPGLYVADASIIPSALGVNPSLTISALALRIGERIVADISG